jgi:hypothetical protein
MALYFRVYLEIGHYIDKYYRKLFSYDLYVISLSPLILLNGLMQDFNFDEKMQMPSYLI